MSNLTRGARASSTGPACDNRQLNIEKLAMTTRIEIRHMHFEEGFAGSLKPLSGLPGCLGLREGEGVPTVGRLHPGQARERLQKQRPKVNAVCEFAQ